MKLRLPFVSTGNRRHCTPAVAPNGPSGAATRAIPFLVVFPMCKILHLGSVSQVLIVTCYSSTWKTP